jgi:hypothetical protein
MAMKITLAQWEGSPAVLVQNPENGEMEGYVHFADGWRPGYVEEVMTKSGVLTEEQFKKMFPGVGLPAELS